MKTPEEYYQEEWDRYKNGMNVRDHDDYEKIAINAINSATASLTEELRKSKLTKTRIHRSEILDKFFFEKECDELKQKLSSDKEKYDKILGLSNTWPLKDVLGKLTDAADKLLHRYNYDGHYHEEIHICLDRGKEIIELLCPTKEVIEEENIHTVTFKLPEETRCEKCGNISTQK